MGCATSSPRAVSPAELATRTLMLSQSRGRRCSQSNALIGALLFPGGCAKDVLTWLEDPVLLAPNSLPDGIDGIAFDLDVPVPLQNEQNARIPTTLLLPTGGRVVVKPPVGTVPGASLSISVPDAALRALGQDTVRVYAGENDAVTAADAPNAAAESSSGMLRSAPVEGGTRPLTADELEAECPIILPEEVPIRLRGYDSICVICKDPLEVTQDAPALALRQMPCAHAFHAQCLDPWLTGVERSCPICRALVGDDDEPQHVQCEAPRGRAWEQYVYLRETGRLAALNRQHQFERDAEEWRAEQEQKALEERIRSTQAGAIIFG